MSIRREINVQTLLFGRKTGKSGPTAGEASFTVLQRRLVAALKQSSGLVALKYHSNTIITQKSVVITNTCFAESVDV